MPNTCSLQGLGAESHWMPWDDLNELPFTCPSLQLFFPLFFLFKWVKKPQNYYWLLPFQHLSFFGLFSSFCSFKLYFSLLTSLLFLPRLPSFLSPLNIPFLLTYLTPAHGFLQ